MNNAKMDYGPHTEEVLALLHWIERGELLRFGKPLPPGSIPIANFEQAQALAADQGETPGTIDWVELREQADAGMNEVGLLDTSAWVAYKDAIKSLLSQVANRVDAALPDDYRDIIDDVIADLHACARCLAVHGRLDPFHERLWQAYSCGGWPCGCAGAPPGPHDTAKGGWRLYVFWRGNRQDG